MKKRINKKAKIRTKNRDIIKLLKLTYQQFGTIRSIIYGCAKIEGLNQVQIGERVKCSSTNSIGSVIGISEKFVTVLFYTNINIIRPKMLVFRSLIMLSRNIGNNYNILGEISDVIT